MKKDRHHFSRQIPLLAGVGAIVFLAGSSYDQPQKLEQLLSTSGVKQATTLHLSVSNSLDKKWEFEITDFTMAAGYSSWETARAVTWNQALE
jgi:hypothetical protein